MERLKSRNFVDHLALTPGAASALELSLNDLSIGPAIEILKLHWKKEGLFLIVGAIGAVTRLIAPLLTSKDDDPAVLVLDAKAFNVVPLLGGHKAGAEELAIQLAADLGGRAVLTGDTNTQGRLSIDSFGDAWGWRRKGDSSTWSKLMRQQAIGKKLSLQQFSGSKLWQNSEAALNCIAQRQSDLALDSPKLFIGSKTNNQCCWHPATIWLGIGCERNTSLSLLERSISVAMKKIGLAEEAIAGIASIDLKSDEPALVEYAKKKNLPVRLFNALDLAKVPVPNPSAYVELKVGTSSVAEAAALLASGDKGVLLKKKNIFHSESGESGALTIAIAESSEAFAPNRGELHLVGSGPGDLALITNDARSALSRSVVWLGYHLYLDFLEPLRRKDQVRINGYLTRERDRCAEAIQLAMQGIRVALVSSGDSGIYGMAGLALELWLDLPKNERPHFQVHPGISAIQMVSSRIGAPIMQDFCVISLSNRLTPWEKIEERLIAAIKGDFVIALYNPQSQDRNWQLKSAMELLRSQRALTTPVVFARQVGRPQEEVELYSLDTLPVNKVDMFTLLLIGNSQSFVQDGWFVTPRGYSKN